ncbi:CLF1 [Mytilus edulis]|uniref:CRN n=1 Tax=Mytilus edulis TaxID=6550 RepID=A0A8S3UY70_MYTED|nr:CLF1 [Mytilus edulis]
MLSLERKTVISVVLDGFMRELWSSLVKITLMKDLLLLLSLRKAKKNMREPDLIYKYALDHLPKDSCQEIYKHYTVHEKKFGSRAAIEDVIVSKRRFKYEEEVKTNPYNYDAWFDYLRLLEADGNTEQIRETYERAIANVPPSKEKRHWRRYIYLWINYAVYEELENDDPDKVREVFKACLDVIPHKTFTFAKIWLLFAQFEIRQKSLQGARRVMYAELETILGDIDRAEAIYELAINQQQLDMPKVLWKSYIDFQIEQEEFDKVRNLYRRLLQRTKHVKVWISFGQFEKTTGEDSYIDKARTVYKEANNAMKSAGEKEERLMLLESWQEFESDNGDEETRKHVDKLMPQKIKKRRKIQTEDGSDAGWEEYHDYIFPDEEASQPNLKLLAMAKKWKQQMEDDEES